MSTTKSVMFASIMVLLLVVTLKSTHASDIMEEMTLEAQKSSMRLQLGEDLGELMACKFVLKNKPNGWHYQKAFEDEAVKRIEVLDLSDKMLKLVIQEGKSFAINLIREPNQEYLVGHCKVLYESIKISEENFKIGVDNSK